MSVAKAPPAPTPALRAAAVEGPPGLDHVAVELLHALLLGQIHAHRLDVLGAVVAQHVGRRLDGRVLRRDDEIEAVLGELARELEADAGWKRR